MSAKEYLEEIRQLDKIINAKIEQLEDLRHMKITATITDDIRTGEVKDRVGDTVAKICNLEWEINDDIDRLIDMKTEAIKKIESVKNVDCRVTLQLRYLNGKTWEHIAESLNYCVSNIYKLHDKALREFEKECSVL